MRFMKIRNLDTFFWIATLGSFRAAAAHIHLTQPAITARIQVLEQDLGTEVFVRDTRKAELTPAGRRLLPYAQKLIKLDQSVIEAFSSSTTVEQSIRLGSSETIVSSWLPDFLSHYAKSRPNLNFDLSVDSTNNLRDSLVAREIDLAFLMGPISESSIESLELCSFDMIFAAAPAVHQEKRLWTAAELSEQTILTFSAKTRPYRLLKEKLVAASVAAPKITSSASLGAAVRLALAGYGVAVLPRAIVKAELQSSELVQMNTDFELPPITFTASFVEDSASSELARDISESASGFIAPRLINKIYQS